MKRILIVTLAVLAVGMWASQSFAAEAAKDKAPAAEVSKDKVVKGTVAVKKGADGKVTEITLNHKDKVAFHVTLDAKGNELAALDGKHVEVTGTETAKEGVKWVTVKSFKEVKHVEKAAEKKENKENKK